MAQTLLKFSIASTDEILTSQSGEIVFGEYLKRVKGMSGDANATKEPTAQRKNTPNQHSRV